MRRVVLCVTACVLCHMQGWGSALACARPVDGMHGWQLVMGAGCNKLNESLPLALAGD